VAAVLRANPNPPQAALAPLAATNKALQVFSRSHDAVIRVCDDEGNVIETHEHKGEFKEP
jgi:hypothetical protein